MTGRPTEYEISYPDLAYKYCLLGATDKQLAEYFGVCLATLGTWKNKYPEFLASLKRGKEVADAKVAEALYKKAIGYEHRETKVLSHEGRVTSLVDITKVYPPDTTACIFWLKNRRRGEWRDKVEVGGNLLAPLSDLLAKALDEEPADAS